MQPEPARGVCDFWIARFSDGTGDADALDADEVAAAAKFGDRGGADRFVQRRSFLRRVLAEYLGIKPADIPIARDCLRCGHVSHGKPRLEASSLDFSASATRELAVVAVMTGATVGVDIEMRGRSKRPDRVAERIAGPEERGRADIDDDAFTVLWTRKEAVLKLLGIGFAINPRRIVLSPPSEPPRVIELPDECGPAAAIAMRELPWSSDHHIAFAAFGGLERLERQTLPG